MNGPLSSIVHMEMKGKGQVRSLIFDVHGARYLALEIRTKCELVTLQISFASFSCTFSPPCSSVLRNLCLSHTLPVTWIKNIWFWSCSIGLFLLTSAIYPFLAVDLDNLGLRSCPLCPSCPFFRNAGIVLLLSEWSFSQFKYCLCSSWTLPLSAFPSTMLLC